MSKNDKATRIRRISGAAGRGVGANTGLGTSDVVLPDFPELPEKVSPETSKEFNGKVDRWRENVQGQLPVPQTSQSSSGSSSSSQEVIVREVLAPGAVTEEELDAVERRVTALESQTETALTADDVRAIMKESRYTHKQLTPSASWVINHGLDAYPSVAIVDSSGTVVGGNVTHQSPFKITVTFARPFSGKAYLIS